MINVAQHEDLFKDLGDRFEINTPMRLAHFLAQIHHESNGFKTMEENLNYSYEALMQKFSRQRITSAQAYTLGRRRANPAKPEQIANTIYGGQWGHRNLGNTQPGDGWKFRGRGPLQCTGRRNYTEFGKYLHIDFTQKPELLATLDIGLLFAGWYWDKNKLNQYADHEWNTPTIAVVNKVNLSCGQVITRRINGGENGIHHRYNLYLAYTKELVK